MEKQSNIGMNKYKNCVELIRAFVAGETSGFSGSSPVLSNTKIINNQVLHYSTPILERCSDFFVLNMTKYSRQTDRLQDAIKAIIPEEKIRIVAGIEIDYKGSIVSFLNK